MRIALIADTFPPLRSSGAVQLRDLSREFVAQGHILYVLLPSHGQVQSWLLDEFFGVKVLRLKAPKTRDVGYVRRALAEFYMPISMLRNLLKSPLAKESWEGLIWYSPSIFFGPLVNYLKKRSNCKSYLIVRDIFPQWAVDMGLMRRGFTYRFLDFVARYQYSVADIIGIQTQGNGKYFKRWLRRPGRRLEVLRNWLGKPAGTKCSLDLDKTILRGRKILVYAGNMGVAQGMDVVLDLAEGMRSRKEVGFLLVGRGSEVARLKAAAQASQLDNVLFFDEIGPDEIPDLYSQCSAGILALDPRHKSHNIPGKFITYMQSGLPVLARVNPGNDLIKLVKEEAVGQVCETSHSSDLLKLSEKLLNQIEIDRDLPLRCKALFERDFLVKDTVRQIVAALSR